MGRFFVFDADQMDAWGFYHLANVQRKVELSRELPDWTAKDVDEFIKSDPVNGARLRDINAAAFCAQATAPIGGLVYGAYCMKFGKSPIAAVGGFAAGALASYLASDFACRWSFGLVGVDRSEPGNRFFGWWAKKHGKSLPGYS